MHFFKSLLVGAAAVVAVVAQSSSGDIAFTQTPASVRPGDKVTLRWDGGDATQPVTINLRRGDSDNLTTVRLITGSATGKSYTWNVPSDLPNASDYTLEINQGVDDSNYSGRFTLSGGTSSSASSATSASTATTSGAATTSAPTSASAIIQSALASKNVTTTVAAGNATTTVAGAFGTGAVGTGAVGSGASGAATGTALPRNTTMSRATLRSTSTSSASSTAAATTTSGSSETSSGGSGGSSETGAPTSGALDLASFASPLALILSAVAAIVYLG